ncbi:MAG: CoA-binding protein [Pseudanabaenales cyanobacterium]|nr:CoA-binding protein [Pseudanabaenales cyanobacterium]
MPDIKGNDTALRQILTQARRIAVVGHSAKSNRPSYQVAQFLRRQGYQVYPVNPSWKEIQGRPCYASLQKTPQPIDIVNVFRRAEYLPGIVDAAIAIGAKTLWTQLDIADQAAAQKAIGAGLNVIMEVCIKVEYLRLVR